MKTISIKLRAAFEIDVTCYFMADQGTPTLSLSKSDLASTIPSQPCEERNWQVQLRFARELRARGRSHTSRL